MSDIQELHTEEQWQLAWPTINSLRPDLSCDDFLNSRAELIKNGYRLFGLTVDKEIVCACGLVIYPHVVRKRDCWIYDLATLPSKRSQGFGKEMLKFVEQLAKEQGCSRICLHTRLHRAEAQNFYENHAQWVKTAYVYEKEL